MLAIYTIGNDEAILVFDHLSPERIMTIDWATVNSDIDHVTKKVYLVTAVQIQLIIRIETPLDMLLQRYVHQWGQDPLATMPLDPKIATMQAAQFPAHVLNHILPMEYLSLSDEQTGKLIHDIQNKLLNIQLQHELLFRMLDKPRFVPQTPILGRNTPPAMRIINIRKYLMEWVNFYETEIRD